MNKTIIKILLVGGLFASLLRVAVDVVSAMRYPGYSFLDQSMSQLAAVGAPTRPLQLVILAIGSILMAAFGIGVLASAEGKITLRITGILFVIIGVVGLLQQIIPTWSMQLEEKGSANAIHIIVTVLMVVVVALFIGFGGFSQGKAFRYYSIATILAMLIFGAWAGSKAPQAIQFTAPWLGALERASYYPHLLWISVFSIVLLRRESWKK